jgi:hypothetical protein
VITTPNARTPAANRTDWSSCFLERRTGRRRAVRRPGRRPLIGPHPATLGRSVVVGGRQGGEEAA